MMMTRCLLALAIAFAVAPALAARQRCIAAGDGTVLCQGSRSPYSDPTRRPGFRAEQGNAYRYGTRSRPHNQPSY